MNIKLKLRKEASLEFHQKIVAAAFNSIENLNLSLEYPFQSCLFCLNFKNDIEICKLANTRPPAKVIVFGCPEFDDRDEIPF